MAELIARYTLVEKEVEAAENAWIEAQEAS
jgi:hypothetical protein